MVSELLSYYRLRHTRLFGDCNHYDKNGNTPQIKLMNLSWYIS